MNSKFRCVVCGGLLVATISIESSFLICHHCGHKQLPEHLPEENFRNDFMNKNMNAVGISGLASTVTASLDIMDFD